VRRGACKYACMLVARVLSQTARSEPISAWHAYKRHVLARFARRSFSAIRSFAAQLTGAVSAGVPLCVGLAFFAEYGLLLSGLVYAPFAAAAGLAAAAGAGPGLCFLSLSMLASCRRRRMSYTFRFSSSLSVSYAS